MTGAAGLFALTAGTGALDGLGLPGGSLHAAAGTLGFLTAVALAIALAVVGATGTPPLTAAWLPLGACVLYVAAAWADHGALRAGAAVVMAAALAAFLAALVPALRRARPLAVPPLEAAAALLVLLSVPLLDLLPEVATIGDADWVPFRAAGARSPSIAAFAILAGMAAAEWRLRDGDRPAAGDTWGLAQVLLFLAGWGTLLAGTAADRLALLVAGAMLHAVALVVFLGRLGPHLPAARQRRGGVWAAAVVLCVAAYAGLVAHLAVGVASGTYLERAAVPDWLAFAVDHVVFVGVAGAGLLAARPDSAERQWSSAGDAS